MENILKQAREKLLIGKSELASKAGISLTTMNRIERGESCRPDTKRKIVKALGFNPWLSSPKVPRKRPPKD